MHTTRTNSGPAAPLATPQLRAGSLLKTEQPAVTAPLPTSPGVPALLSTAPANASATSNPNALPSPAERLPDAYFYVPLTASSSQGAGPGPLDYSHLRHPLISLQILAQLLHSPPPEVGKMVLPGQPAQAVFLQSLNNHTAWLVSNREGHILGLVNDQGNLRVPGLPGVQSFFNNSVLQVNYGNLANNGPVGKALLQLAFDRAHASNAAPFLRQAYPSLSGQGRSVAIIDFDPDHLKNLWSIINSPALGVAPQADVIPFTFQKAPSSFHPPNSTTAVVLPKTPEEFKQRIVDDFVADFAIIQHQLQRVLELPKPPDAVVLSLTMERHLEYNNLVDDVIPKLLREINTLPENQRTHYQGLQRLLTNLSPSDPVEQQLRVQAFVNQTLDESPELADTLKQYQQLTQQLVRHGTLPLVAAGNSENQLPRNVNWRRDSVLNFLAASPYVLVVGGSDNRGTPDNFYDDRVAAFSNPAMAVQPSYGRNHVDLLAPAVLVPIDASYLGHPNEQAFNNGTSLAAPFVAGVVALMKQANPTLSAQQVETLLLNSGVNPSHLDLHWVGNGFLNFFKSIDQALASSNQPSASQPATPADPASNRPSPLNDAAQQPVYQPLNVVAGGAQHPALQRAQQQPTLSLSISV